MPLVGRFLEKVYADPKYKGLQGPFPKPAIPISKEYLNCGYSGDEEESTEESDSTALDQVGDSTFVPTSPAPDQVPPIDTTGTQ